ncbi:MAG: poly-gamma-glutamate system protein [Ignavibacteriae bacterium]|nr:poly-gamma-glutamate system protein [Ignavibacteriota bacterium]
MINKKPNNHYLPNVKFTFGQLLFLSILSVAIVLSVNFFSTSQLREGHVKMAKAANKMNVANQKLREFRKSLNLEIDRNFDPLLSGFIGTEFSPITTTLGDLHAKQISTNPDFAALFILWFNQLNLKKNDNIVIHLSGSFPALGIAAIIACEFYGLNPIILSSIGASSFGANYPQLTYWDIESYLYKKKIISNHTSYATFGGQNDNGSSFWEDGVELGIEAAKRNNLKVHIFDDINDVIEDKLVFIKSKEPITLFINIGGNQSAVGNTPTNIFSDYGLIKTQFNNNGDGLLSIMNKMNIPIIHMLNIKDIALENGIDLIPNRNYKVRESDLYISKGNSKTTIVVALILISLALTITSRISR